MLERGMGKRGEERMEVRKRRGRRELRGVGNAEIRKWDGKRKGG